MAKKAGKRGTTTKKAARPAKKRPARIKAAARKKPPEVVTVKVRVKPTRAQIAKLVEAEHAQLEKLWAEHIKHEFVTLDVEATLATMVDDASVNHVPIGSGGKGKDELRAFYRDVFIGSWPDDLQMTTFNRVISDHQLVEEDHLRFTHSKRMEWFLPGVAPTHKRIEVDFVVVVQFRENKLCCERIYWDHATVLRQVGLLQDSAPSPAPPAEVPAVVREFLARNAHEMPWDERYNEKIGRALFRKELFSDPETGMMVRLVRYPAGVINPAHTHPCGHGMYVLEGNLVTHKGTFSPGSFVWFPEGEVMEHGASPEGDAVVVFITNKSFRIDYVT